MPPASDERPQWPDGAKCIAAITVDWDGHSLEVGRDLEPVGIRAAGGYSARRGVHRMLDIFGRHEIAATFFVPGYDAEQHANGVRELIAAGHEVGAHGYTHESGVLGREEEQELLERSHAILSDVTGTPPVGWRSPSGRKTHWTTSVLRRLGYIYESSDKDYERPYPTVVEGEPSTEMIEFPNNTLGPGLDDAPLWTAGVAPYEVLDLWKAEFDAIYADEGYFVLTFHPRAGFGTGTPARAHVVDELLTHIRAHDGVHFTRFDELARWCLEADHGFLDPPARIGGRP
ncbi:MAG: polysaccharide deacetylase family protein [Dehalococcoidia bacterium]|nr:polysaccharide deacetylase family protein [Dehalococcoidia bacterium]